MDTDTDGETELFIPTNKSNDERQRCSSKELKADSDSKLATTSFYGLLMITIGTLMYSSVGTLNRLSRLNRLPYNSNAALVIAEMGKFVASIALLLWQEGYDQAKISVQSVPFKEWFLFAIPAVIYSITNNLDFFILSYMDPGSMSVLQQTKIITTALLWWYMFQQSIDKQQWIALALLCSGSCLVAIPDSKSSTSNAMFVTWPMGPLLILCQVSLSAIAGIFTEMVYKSYGKNRSMHVDNLSMYFWGTISNFLQYYVIDGSSNGLFGLTHNFNAITWLFILNVMTLGLSIAFVMKFFDNIVKLLMSGMAIVGSGILSYFVFNLRWTFTYCSGLIVVICAVILYKSPKKFIK